MGKTVLETSRMTLRPWREDDAESLYEYARDPRVGPAAGWPPHTSVENSRQIIRNVLAVDESYAIVLKGDTQPVGSIGLTFYPGEKSGTGEKSGEIGYWIGVPFWGRGLVPEAVRELLRHSFEDLEMDAIWCGYYEGNEKSRRVQEKCGFCHHHTKPDQFCPQMHETRTEHFSCLTKAQWLQVQKGAAGNFPK